MNTREEMETTFRFDALRDEVRIFTAYLPMKRKIERRGWTPSKVTRYHGKEAGWFYRVPYRSFRWGVKPQMPGIGPVPEAK